MPSCSIRFRPTSPDLVVHSIMLTMSLWSSPTSSPSSFWSNPRCADHSVVFVRRPRACRPTGALVHPQQALVSLRGAETCGDATRQGVTREGALLRRPRAGGAILLLSNTVRARSGHVDVGIGTFRLIPTEFGGHIYIVVHQIGFYTTF